MVIFQAVAALQVLMILRSTIEIIASSANLTHEFSCRIVVFLTLVLAILPAYLCNFCLIYLQMTLLYRVSARKRWPKVVLAVACVVPAVIPESFVLFIPTETAGLQSYCEYDGIPQRREYVFKWLVCNIWIVLAGIIAMVSMLITIVHISRTVVESPKMADLNAEIAHKNSILSGFPITPIVSLYFNEDNIHMDRTDSVLQFLQAWWVALAFYASPPVRRSIRSVFGKGRSRRSDLEVDGNVFMECSSAVGHKRIRVGSADSDMV
ncbi:hypothetical protein DL89DRAFT_265441 [Linderina pennispora]|uniref:Uncharacterized protein n=1 Tax=Linderina pennispora TaxID=61395 RepID=A0A1Y1WIJ6_9FUNG|nr:uncharacterized protein DL89DRAFT_265441 [Linderina pennispora]ORX73359.1 hypothetical protein DL89DRAFT_265441 [Linderina pennispora]